MNRCDVACYPRCCQLALGRVVVVDAGEYLSYANVRAVRVYRTLGIGLWVSKELALRLWPPTAARWVVPERRGQRIPTSV
jgi:hypothetical protein